MVKVNFQKGNVEYYIMGSEPVRIATLGIGSYLLISIHPNVQIIARYSVLWNCLLGRNTWGPAFHWFWVVLFIPSVAIESSNLLQGKHKFVYSMWACWLSGYLFMSNAGQLILLRQTTYSENCARALALDPSPFNYSIISAGLRYMDKTAIHPKVFFRTLEMRELQLLVEAWYGFLFESYKLILCGHRTLRYEKLQQESWGRLDKIQPSVQGILGVTDDVVIVLRWETFYILWTSQCFQNKIRTWAGMRVKVVFANRGLIWGVRVNSTTFE